MYAEITKEQLDAAMLTTPYLSKRFKARYIFKSLDEEILDAARKEDWQAYIEAWRKFVIRPAIVTSILSMTFAAGYLVALFK